jgi:hypothetical protein
MKAIFLTLMALALSLALAGCGGGGGSEPTIIGQWSGTFVTTDTPPQYGTINIVVSPTRTVTGSLNNTTSGSVGAITGSVDLLGSFTGSVSYANGAVVYTARGEFLLTDDNKMAGQVRIYSGSTLLSTANCNLTRQ